MLYAYCISQKNKDGQRNLNIFWVNDVIMCDRVVLPDT